MVPAESLISLWLLSFDILFLLSGSTLLNMALYTYLQEEEEAKEIEEVEIMVVIVLTIITIAVVEEE